MDNGGGESKSQYNLIGSVGQLDTGAMQGGGYALTGGFWFGATTNDAKEIYLPLILKND